MFKTIRLSYTSSQDHIKYAPTPFDGVVIVPDDRDIPGIESDDFVFELVYKDHDLTCAYYVDSPPNWHRFFPSKRRDYLLSRGCSCCDSCINRNLCASCVMINCDEYHAYIEESKTFDVMTMSRKRDYISVPQRTYTWKQVGGPRIHWCYYDVDRAKYTDYNFGEIVLEQLNDEVETIKKAQNIVNSNGQYITSGCLLLRRQDAEDGTIPPYEGITVIHDVEHLNSRVFY